MAVVEEAIAIRTSYLQTALIPQPQSGSIRSLLRDDANGWLLWADVPTIPPVRAATVLQSLLWQQTADVGQKSSDVVALFVESMNRTFYLRAKREMLRRRSRIPGGYIAALLAITLLAHVAMGHHGGVAGTDRSPVMVLVGIAFSLVILLIFDLDRPGEGLINVSQQRMIDLRNWMLTAQPFP